MLKSDPNTVTEVEIPASELTMTQQKISLPFSFYFFPSTRSSDIVNIQVSSYFLLMAHFLFRVFDLRLWVS